MALKCSQNVMQKLQSKHGVSLDDVQQCFANRTGGLLEDSREEHKTEPPTQWFVAENDFGRMLKVVFVAKDGDIFIKTAYEANEKEVDIYRRFGCSGL